MSEKQWKKPQLEAIEISHPRILVSASAGTGKTTVLTERLIRKLTCEDPLDVNEVIVVTFTKAAADELKNRISDALSKALAKNPGNRALSRQLVSLSHAKISTIHSFCLDLIRRHFEDLGLDPNVRVIDDDEKTLFTNEIVKNVLDDYYEKSPEIAEDERIGDFPAFIDRFVDIKDDAFSEELLKLYDRLRGLPDGFSLVTKSAADYDEAAKHDFFASPWGACLRSDIRNTLLSVKCAAESQIRAVTSIIDPAFPEDTRNYMIGLLQSDADAMDELLRADGTYAGLYDRMTVNTPNYDAKKNNAKIFADSKTVKDTCEEIKAVKAARNAYRARVNKLKSDLFLFNEEEIRTLASDFASVSRDLSRLLLRLDRVLRAEKRKRGILDFGDIETYAFELLEKDGKPTETAMEISRNYKEICIDEYQDVNELQDRIFTAISGTTERFMVGDIKQSIYAFRGASPLLFSGYRENAEVGKVYLQHNFRCSRSIIRFVNRVSGSTFTAKGSGFTYDAGDDLVAGADDAPDGVKPEVILMTGEEDRINSITAESEYIAERIAQMMKDEGRKPSDFVILLRSCNHAFFYETSLTKRGIPVYSQLSHEFFENPEILMMLCILNVIDNPTNDIYLSGILRSPLFGFTLDELLNVRADASGGSLYEALVSYSDAHPGFTKARRFLDKLKEYRKAAASVPVDKLIWKLYTDNEILSLIYADEKATGDDITVRRANLMLLYENARKFESDSFRGLYPFIRYLAQMLESKAGEKLESAQPFGEGMNTVKIMSIHKSKGLEFPVVFLARANSEFSKADAMSLIAFSRETGICFKPTDSTDSVRLTTPFWRGELAALNAGRNAEEMRVLYVALTRAKEKLFVSGIYKDEQALESVLSLLKRQPFASADEKNAAFSESPSYLKWILLSLRDEPDCAELKVITDQTGNQPLTLFSEPDAETEEEPAALTEEEEKMKEAFREAFAFRYPYPESTKIPAKLSVSDLYPEILDEGENDGTGTLSAPGMGVKPKKPLFLQNENGTPRAGAAEIGTATHVFMQFCSFEETERNGVDAEVKRLTEKRFMPESMAALVDKDAIRAFLSSPLYAEMKKARELKRETRFNVRLPAGEFTSDPEKAKALENETVLVQGVIDCYFLTEGGKVILVDYKTDRVPGDRRKAEALLKERHTLQLSYYRRALEKILLRPVDRTLVYSFGLNDTVEIP